MHGRRLAILVGLAAVFALAPGVAAADPLTISGRLSPVVGNPAADPDGRGVAVLTINDARTELTYKISYRNVAVPITAIYFCGGQKPRAYPIPITCAFAISPSDGGPSPITGTTSIVPAQADVLASGYAVIQLVSASGPQLAGYVQVGPPPTDTLTAPAIGARPASDPLIAFALGALLAFVFSAASRLARGGSGSKA